MEKFTSMKKSETQTPKDRINEVLSYKGMDGLNIWGPSSNNEDLRPLYNPSKTEDRREFSEGRGIEALIGKKPEEEQLFECGVVPGGKFLYAYQIIDEENQKALIYTISSDLL